MDNDLLSLPRAGFWVRFGAAFIDGFLISVIGALTHLGFFGAGTWALYQIGMWAWKGTTIGGIVFGIQGVRTDGRPMDFATALVRHLSSYLSSAVLCLGFFWMLWDAEKQTWHDKIAGTLVVKVPKNQPLI